MLAHGLRMADRDADKPPAEANIDWREVRRFEPSAWMALANRLRDALRRDLLNDPRFAAYEILQALTAQYGDGKGAPSLAPGELCGFEIGLAAAFGLAEAFSPKPSRRPRRRGVAPRAAELLFALPRDQTLTIAEIADIAAPRGWTDKKALSSQIYRFVSYGLLTREARGSYRVATAPPSDEHIETAPSQEPDAAALPQLNSRPR